MIGYHNPVASPIFVFACMQYSATQWFYIYTPYRWVTAVLCPDKSRWSTRYKYDGYDTID